MKSSKLFNIAAALTASLFLAGTAVANEKAKGPKDINSIVDVAVAENFDAEGPYFGAFDTLIALLTQEVANRAAILGALDSRGQYTVFAPTDDAFARLAETALTLGYCSLADLPASAVDEVLLYHVAPGRRDSSDVLSSDQINTLYGEKLGQEAAVLTDAIGRKANLIPGAIDIMTDNGIIHAIDAVVLPFLPPPGPGNCTTE